MDLANRLKDHVPVWTAEVGRCAKTSDSVLFGIGIVDHDVRCIICFDLGSEVLEIMSVSEFKGKKRGTHSVNLNVVVNILSLDSQKQRSEPFERSKISADPEEVNLP